MDYLSMDTGVLLSLMRDTLGFIARRSLNMDIARLSFILEGFFVEKPSF